MPKKVIKETVTFQIPPFYSPCCRSCQGSNRDVALGNSYPVVQREKADEVAGGERVYIKMDCGKIHAYSALYFK